MCDRPKAIKQELAAAAGLEEFDVEKLELHCTTKRRRYFRVRWAPDLKEFVSGFLIFKSPKDERCWCGPRGSE